MLARKAPTIPIKNASQTVMTAQLAVNIRTNILEINNFDCTGINL
jgi:hypothetical protein